MSRKSKKIKILWAFDPFEENDEVRKHVLASLERICSSRSRDQTDLCFSPAEYGLSDGRGIASLVQEK